MLGEKPNQLPKIREGNRGKGKIINSEKEKKGFIFATHEEKPNNVFILAQGLYNVPLSGVMEV